MLAYTINPPSQKVEFKNWESMGKIRKLKDQFRRFNIQIIGIPGRENRENRARREYKRNTVKQKLPQTYEGPV